MTQSAKTLTVDLKRVIAGPPAKVYEAWMDPKQPCNPWSYGKQVVFEPKAGRLFCVVMGSAGAHFGRILTLSKGRQLRHTWMSRYTRGLESTVTVTFRKHAAGTLMTLRHSGLPNDDFGKAHVGGWGDFFGMIERHFADTK
jgi:uncharacterized protein YndB with AHSA1/START domain